MPFETFKLGSVGAKEHAPTPNVSRNAPQLRKGNSTLHVDGSVADVPCTWLLDTGADVTCVSAQLPGIQGLAWLPPTTTPSAANSTRLECVGEIVTKIKIGHVTKHSVRVLVIQNLNSPAILGLNVLQEYDHMAIDWRAQTLELGGHKLMLERRTLGTPRQPTEICLIMDEVIPARSQCFITAASVDFGLVAQDTLFTPYQEKLAKCNILLGSGVVKQEPRNQIPVIAMNNSDKPVKLYRGTTLGQLSSIRIEEEESALATLSNPTNKKSEPVKIDLTDSCLGADEKEVVQQLLQDYRDIFANDETEVGRTSRIQFQINTGNHPPVAVKLRRTPFALRSEVDRQIKEMEERGVIRKSSSPWSSPILLVPKKDGSYRFCADFRALNDVTRTEIFPLPSIRECLDSLGGSAMFSTLDLHSGYWQINIDHKDRHKTAFTTESGHWEFLVMPFGVKMPQQYSHD